MEKKMLLTLGATALGCLIVGLGGGYWIGKKQTELEAFHIANMEVASAKEHYQIYWKTKYEDKIAEYDRKLLELTTNGLVDFVTDSAEPNEIEKQLLAAAELKTTENIDSDVAERQAEVYNTVTKDEPVEEIVRPKPPVPMTAVPVASQRRERVMVNYSGAFRADKAAEPEIEEKATDDPVDPTAPFDIPEEEYYDGNSGFKQRQVKWYAADEVLTSIDDVPLDDTDLVVGNTLEVFSELEDSDNVIYVRNPGLKTDLEVIRIHESFAEHVQGLMT